MVRRIALAAALVVLATTGCASAALSDADVAYGARRCGLDFATGAFEPEDVRPCDVLTRRTERRDGEFLVVSLLNPGTDTAARPDGSMPLVSMHFVFDAKTNRPVVVLAQDKYAMNMSLKEREVVAVGEDHVLARYGPFPDERACQLLVRKGNTWGVGPKVRLYDPAALDRRPPVLPRLTSLASVERGLERAARDLDLPEAERLLGLVAPVAPEMAARWRRRLGGTTVADERTLEEIERRFGSSADLSARLRAYRTLQQLLSGKRQDAGRGDALAAELRKKLRPEVHAAAGAAERAGQEATAAALFLIEHGLEHGVPPASRSLREALGKTETTGERAQKLLAGLYLRYVPALRVTGNEGLPEASALVAEGAPLRRFGRVAVDDARETVALAKERNAPVYEVSVEVVRDLRVWSRYEWVGDEYEKKLKLAADSASHCKREYESVAHQTFKSVTRYEQKTVHDRTSEVVAPCGAPGSGLQCKYTTTYTRTELVPVVTERPAWPSATRQAAECVARWEAEYERLKHAPTEQDGATKVTWQQWTGSVTARARFRGETFEIRRDEHYVPEPKRSKASGFAASVQYAEGLVENDLAAWIRARAIAAAGDSWKGLSSSERDRLRHLFGWAEGTTPADGIFVGPELFGATP